MKGQKMEKPQRRIRLNQELRNKISSRMRVHLEAEDTQERKKFHDLRNDFKSLQDKSWKLAETNKTPPLMGFRRAWVNHVTRRQL